MASIAFGIIQLATGHFNQGLLPVPPALPAINFWLYLTAVILLVTGTGILYKPWRYPSAIILGIFYCILFLAIHLLPLLGNPYNPNIWTAAVEVLSLSCGAFFIAAIEGRQQMHSTNTKRKMPRWIIRAAKYAFSFSLLVFAFLHFKYASFIATLIPSWVPAKLFLALFIGAGFAAAAVSIIINKLAWLSMNVLGCMFLVWVLILHLPRTFAKMQEEPEWTSLFVAMAFSGMSFALGLLANGQKN